MKTYFLLLILLPLLTLSSLSCTHSSENDVIVYVPKQVRELTTAGEATTTETMLSLAYDSQGRIQTEADAKRTANISYAADSRIDSVNFVMTDAAKALEREAALSAGVAEADISVTDSIRAVYTYSGSDIAVTQLTFRSQGNHDTTGCQIMLNAGQLPVSYVFGDAERRYSYADSLLTGIAYYENGVLKGTHSYEYAPDIKSPYCEVRDYPAWYFVVYRNQSPGGFAIKSTLDAVVVYELSSLTLSDLQFVTHATKTYYESSGAREVTYRQDYAKLVFD